MKYASLVTAVPRLNLPQYRQTSPLRIQRDKNFTGQAGQAESAEKVNIFYLPLTSFK